MQNWQKVGMGARSPIWYRRTRMFFDRRTIITFQQSGNKETRRLTLSFNMLVFCRILLVSALLLVQQVQLAEAALFCQLFGLWCGNDTEAPACQRRTSLGAMLPGAATVGTQIDDGVACEIGEIRTGCACGVGALATGAWGISNTAFEETNNENCFCRATKFLNTDTVDGSLLSAQAICCTGFTTSDS